MHSPGESKTDNEWHELRKEVQCGLKSVGFFTYEIIDALDMFEALTRQFDIELSRQSLRRCLLINAGLHPEGLQCYASNMDAETLLTKLIRQSMDELLAEPIADYEYALQETWIRLGISEEDRERAYIGLTNIGTLAGRMQQMGLMQQLISVDDSVWTQESSDPEQSGFIVFLLEQFLPYRKYLKKKQ